MTTPPPGPFHPPPRPGGPGPNQGWQGPYAPPPGQVPPPGPWGAPPPPPRSNRTALIVIGSLIAVIGLGVGTLVAVNASGGDSGTTTAAATGTGTAPTPQESSAAAPTGEGEVTVDVGVGDCINLSGTDAAAEAVQEECGSAQANYKVFSIAATADECPKDADAYYYETEVFGSDETGALCLDYDWEPGNCYDATSATDVVPTDCAAGADPAKTIVRFLEILEDTVDDSRCEVFGVPYTERRFVACFEDVIPS